jgi:Mn-dependent DtxR family transcriptional regulator
MPMRTKARIQRVSPKLKAKVLEAVKVFCKENKVPATYSDIVATTGVARSTAFAAVRELGEAGKLIYSKGMGRSIRPKGR